MLNFSRRIASGLVNGSIQKAVSAASVASAAVANVTEANVGNAVFPQAGFEPSLADYFGNQTGNSTVPASVVNENELDVGTLAPSYLGDVFGSGIGSGSGSGICFGSGIGSRSFSTSAAAFVRARQYLGQDEDVSVIGGMSLLSGLESSMGIEIKDKVEIVIAGAQSSGKSTFSEQLLEFYNLLTKKSGIGTKKPTQIRAVRSDGETFYVVQGEKFIREQDAFDKAAQMNNNGAIKRVDVEIHAPGLVNQVVVDLPGLFYRGKDKDFRDSVREMTIDYVNRPNTIIVAAHNANSDPANADIIQIISDADPDLNKMNDTIGVLTKADLAGKNVQVLRLLRGELPDYEVGGGWFMALGRTSEQVEANMTPEEFAKVEEKFFKKHPNFKPSGMKSIREKILEMAYHKMKNSFPAVHADLDIEIAKRTKSMEVMSRIASEGGSALASQMKEIILQVVPSAPQRRFMNQDLLKEIYAGVMENVTPILSNTDNFPKVSDRYVDPMTETFLSSRDANPKDYDTTNSLQYPGFYKFGGYGAEVSDSDALRKARNAYLNLCVSTNLVNWFRDDPHGKKRYDWIKFQQKFYKQVAGTGLFFQVSREVTRNVLTSYLIGDHKENAHHVALVDHLVDTSIKKGFDPEEHTINTIVAANAEPEVNLLEMTRYLSQKFPEHFDFSKSNGILDFFRRKPMIDIEEMGPIFNDAHIVSTMKYLSGETYKVITNVIINNLLDEILIMHSSMDNKEDTQKQVKKMRSQISELKYAKEYLLELEDKMK